MQVLSRPPSDSPLGTLFQPRKHFDGCLSSVLSAVTRRQILEHQPPVLSNHGSTNPVPVTIQSPLVMVHGIISLKTALSEIIVLNDGVLKSTALLHSKVIISILPILIGTGHYRQPASLAPVHPMNSG